MEVYEYHSNITQKWHGASRNYRYVLDVSVHPSASFCFRLFLYFRFSRYENCQEKSKKNYIKNQRSGNNTASEGQPGGATRAPSALAAPPPPRAAPGGAPGPPAPPPKLPRCPTLAYI